MESDKAGLKLNIQKAKIMASGPFTSWQTDEGKVEVVTDFVFLDSREIRPVNPKFSSVQFSCSVVSDSLRPHESQHARPPCPSPTTAVHSDSRPSS